MIGDGVRLAQKILCYLVCLLAVVGLILIWSATPAGIDVYETLRLLVLAAGWRWRPGTLSRSLPILRPTVFDTG